MMIATFSSFFDPLPPCHMQKSADFVPHPFPLTSADVMCACPTEREGRPSPVGLLSLVLPATFALETNIVREIALARGEELAACCGSIELKRAAL